MRGLPRMHTCLSAVQGYRNSGASSGEKINEWKLPAAINNLAFTANGKKWLRPIATRSTYI